MHTLKIHRDFSTIKASLQSGQKLSLTDKIQFEFFADDADATLDILTQWSGISKTRQGQDTVVFKQQSRPQYAGSVEDKHLTSSWMIDFDEPSVKETNALVFPNADTTITAALL